MSTTQLGQTQETAPESGLLEGRYEFVPEPAPGELPTDPDFQLISDAMRTFEAEVGTSYGAQNTLGDPDPADHFRGTEDPSLSVGYDLQRFFVDGSGDPRDLCGYGMVRDADNQLPSSLLFVGRREYPGGVNGTGSREYTVVRGAFVESASLELDPSAERPILAEAELMPRRVRSYRIDQPPAAGATVEVESTSDNDTMDVVVESEGANTTETLTLNGTTTVTGTSTFTDIDAVELAAPPEGDVSVKDPDGNTLLEIAGGNTYSDDDQPVDGDRGVPALGEGSRGSPLDTSFEHFLGDRFERPVGETVAPRVNSASLSIENEIETQALAGTRAPAVDVGNRTVSADVDIAGRFMSHDKMRESLEKVQNDLEHELSGGTVRLKNTVVESPPSQTIESEQAVASESITLVGSGRPALVLTAN